MFKKLLKNKNSNSLTHVIIGLFLFVILLFFSNNLVGFASSDAIAIRVFPNLDHLSARDWYNKQEFTGSPQSMLVDGYEAVRDGNSVYVNVSNLVDTPPGDGVLDALYTNIYLITYNINADNETSDIFGNILENWKFNSNISGTGLCHFDTARYCVYDDDCSIGDFCGSLKAKVIRDTKRLSDLSSLNIRLDNYYNEHGSYPSLSSGSYLPGKTLSVWPSWTSSFSSEIGASVPVDPVNDLGPCGGVGFDEKTCWNDVIKTFSDTLPDLPTNSLVYGYFSIGNGTNYDLCTTFETPYNVLPPLASFSGCTQACLDFDGDSFGSVGSVCANPLADCDDTNPNIKPGAVDICGDGIDQDCFGGDTPCAATCVDNDGDGVDTCDVPADCDDNDASRFPGNPEICNGIDDNCSGVTPDEGCDADNDNYCDCGQTFVDGAFLLTCTQTDNTNAASRATTCDCDESNTTINPGASELCDNLDNNCSGFSDEGCDADGDGYCACPPALPSIVVNPFVYPVCSLTNPLSPLTIAQTCDCMDGLGFAGVNPGNLSETDCTNSLDDDCDGDIDALDSDCTPLPGCGNGVLDPGEDCDDGNTSNGDGCNISCLYTCGDGFVSPPEECDDANSVDGDGCNTDSNNCLHTCGDGSLDSGEECDDGNSIDGDGCNTLTASCSYVCGDGSCSAAESASGSCPGDCTLPPVCGNGVVESGEDCDDGNTVDGDGCNTDSNNCQFTCGDGFCSAGEAGLCFADCPVPAVCGNGAVEMGEDCDDGNAIDGDGCNSNCLHACGDGTVTAPEDCDDGNTTDGDGCNTFSSSCAYTCGDGTVIAPEECDDGNTVDGDGCNTDSNNCLHTCGDGSLDPGEDCDDGNTTDGDGCNTISSSCAYTCGDGLCDPVELLAGTCSDCVTFCNFNFNFPCNFQ
ncbi:hypothetical protein C0584_01095 [Candidatus Parcubacteria bacterium]|nr:MAG: hypothetical protein C0584_01095 [Candidatus Parcubacteria bacterium]